MRRSKIESAIEDFLENILPLICYLLILFLIWKLAGWFWLLIIISTIIFILFLWHRHVENFRIRAKREQEAREKVPCKHGVIGANKYPSKCSICQQERRKIREEERMRKEALREQQAEEQRRQDEEERRLFEEWKRQGEDQRRQIDWWKSLDGRRFEKELNNLLRKRGYNTTLTPYSADGGVDILIREGEKKIIIQCKAHSHPISSNVIRELYGTMIHEKADEGWLVTTSDFSSGAYKFVRNKPIKLLTIKQLLQEG